MTRTISIITATVGAALLFAVPAWGDSWGADQNGQSVGYLNPDAADRAATADQNRLSATLDAREQALGVSVENQVNPLEARERSFGAKHDAQLVSGQYPDWFERAAAAAIRSNREIVVDDRFRLDPTTVSSPVTATSSGREIDWPQVGIGFGIGLVLALGLFVATRYTRIRSLAH